MTNEFASSSFIVAKEFVTSSDGGVFSLPFRSTAMDSIRRLHPEVNDREIQLKFIEITYGQELSVAICTKHTQQVIKVYPELKEKGVEMIGVSPDSV